MSARRTAHVRLIPAAVTAWISALLATTVPSTAAAVAATLWTASLGALVTIVWLVAGRRRAPATHRRAAIVLLALVAGAVAASHVALAQPQRMDVERFALNGGRAVTVEATVTGKIERSTTGQWVFDAVATRMTTGSLTDAVHVPIMVRVQPSEVDRAIALDMGSEVALTGTARPAPHGSRAVLTVTASRGLHILAAPTGLLALTSDLRRGLVRSTAGLPDPGAGLVPGLAVGDTSAVSAALDDAMKQSSLSHLTAVSGANCAIVVGLAFAAIAAAGGSRRARVVGAMAALGAFVLLVTPEPSVVRAGAMAAIAMLGVLLGRTGVGMALLSLAVILLLVADPWLAGSLGFALSAVATASLLLYARPLAAGLARWMPRSLALALSVPLAAQLACGPLLVLITPTVPLYGVVANLLAAPAAPVATIVGLAACVTAPVPWLQSGLTAIAWLPSAWIAGTAQTFSAIPGDQVPWLEGWAGVGALAAVGVAIGIVVAAPVWGPQRRGHLVKVIAGVSLAVVAGVVVGGAALASVAGRWTLPAQWDIVACDVGQGDAVLIRSGDAIALIDTGPDPELLDRCLARVGVVRIDLLVLTHFDLDHIGGVDAVVGRVATTLHGAVGTAEEVAVLARLEHGGARVMLAHAPMRGTLGDAQWRVLWPFDESHAYAPGNDTSVVLDVRGGGMPASLFLGDLSASPQSALRASGAMRPPYDVVKVAHHGSADQDLDLYARAAPAVGLLTVGVENTYGHPRDEILTALEALGTVVARTDLHGLIALWEEDSAVRVWRERAGDVGPAG